jgi:hypothetical protein
MGNIFERWITKLGSIRTTRTLNRKTGKFTSTTTRVKPKKTTTKRKKRK